MTTRRQMIADVVCECRRLREELELERARRRTAEGYADARGKAILQLEEAVEVFKGRCAELAGELDALRSQAAADLPCKLATLELYRSVLTDVEQAMHRLPLSGCGFGHDHQEGTTP